MSKFEQTHIDAVCLLSIFFATIGGAISFLNGQFVATTLAGVCVGIAVFVFLDVTY